MVIFGKRWTFAGKRNMNYYAMEAILDTLIDFKVSHCCILYSPTYRRAIELVETKERCRRRKAVNERSQVEPPSKPLRVTLSHIASVISEVYSSTVTSSSAQESIPLQQKLVACTLLLMVRSHPRKEITLGKLHEAYTKVCHKRRLKFESETEFVGLCSMLATSGIISLKKAKETRLMKVRGTGVLVQDFKQDCEI